LAVWLLLRRSSTIASNTERGFRGQELRGKPCFFSALRYKARLWLKLNHERAVVLPLKGTDMRDTAEILAFKGKEIKTVRDLSGAQLALLHDITSGAVTPAESRLVQEELSARLWEFEASLKAARVARAALNSLPE